MNIIANQSLQHLNSFGFSARAAHYVQVTNDEQLLEALDTAEKKQWPIFLLGGGSNLVLTQNIAGLVIHQINQHTNYQEQTDGTTHVVANAGKPWHDLVLETLDRRLAGLENLSLIPGNTGAAPVQNIGAYGVELVNRLHSVRAYHLPSKQWLTLSPNQCAFSYRDSVFKQNPNDYVITQVTLALNENTPAVLTYAALESALQTHDLSAVDNVARAKLISDTVIRIRQSKLPDPKQLGNAGSFFKNPVVSAAHAKNLRQTYPKLVSYPQADGRVKLAAGWMIDALGFRGHEANGVGVHTEQALVLVNHGGGDGAALMALANRIIEQVQANFSVKLEIEPVII